MVYVPTMTAVVVPHVLRIARQAGVDPTPVVARLRLIDAPRFEDRLPFSLIADFWEAIGRLVQDPWLPIRAAAIPEHEELSVLGMCCHAQATLGDALRMMARYWLLVTDAYHVSVGVGRDRVVIAFDVASAVERLGVRCQVEFDVCNIVRVIERVTGGARPLDVAVAHPRPRAAGAPPWPASREPRFGAARTQIEYAQSIWDRRLPGAKPELVRMLRPKLDMLLVMAEGRVTPPDRVRLALPELLRTGDPHGQRLALRLSTSWRTLQRQLADAGTTFRALRDETRFRLAREWLGHTPIKIVAERLGYSDARAFDRAFRRWAGTSPMNFSQTAHPTPPIRGTQRRLGDRRS
jgi:AraC-like DNA-binding protein